MNYRMKAEDNRTTLKAFLGEYSKFVSFATSIYTSLCGVPLRAISTTAAIVFGSGSVRHLRAYLSG